MKRTLLLPLLFQAAALFAQPEFLDPAFGVAGRQTLVGSADDGVQDVAVQPDGKILLAGTSFEGSNFRYSMARFHPDGSPDTGFGLNGANHTFFLPGYITGSIDAVALQANGKIVALGHEGSIYHLARYLPDGHPDLSFAFPALAQFDHHYALVIAPDDKILLAGYKNNGAGHFMVRRFKPDGTKDDSFGTGGIVALDFGTSSAESATDLAVQPDGKIVATGVYGNDLVLVRLDSNGSLDTNFNATGKLLIDGGANSYSGRFLFLRPDGKIVVGATESNTISLFRVNPNGSLDDTFGSAGEAKIAGFGKYGGFNDMKMRPDGGFWLACTENSGGKYVVINLMEEGVLDTNFADAGILPTPWNFHFLALQTDSTLVVASTSDGDFALGRYLPSGNFDPAFHQGVPVVANVGQSGGPWNALAVQPDGKIVGAGGNVGTWLSIARFNGDGSPDGDFLARSGPISSMGGTFNALFIQPDGKIVAGGNAPTGEGSNGGVLYRFLPDGTPDADFPDQNNPFIPFINALAPQPDGKFLAAGVDYGDTGGFWSRLVRYQADGKVDPNFGANGYVSTNPCYCTLLALQTDGKILVAGRKGADEFMVARYLSDGSPDSTFGTNGSIQGAGGVDLMNLLPDGKILLAANENNGLALSRYLPGGAPDTDFGVGGKRFLTLKLGEYIYAMRLQADGKILLAGDSEGRFLLARLLSDGSPDISVGLGGFVHTSFDDLSSLVASAAASSLTLQPDGKIILGGISVDYGSAYEKPKFALARYRADLTVESKEVYGTEFQALELFPNPATDFLNIELPENEAIGPLAVQVFDAAGKLVLEKRLAAAGQTIDLHGLAPGVFALKVMAGERVYVGRFVKQ